MESERDVTMIVCAYLLIGLFFVMERRIRQGKEAMSLEAGQFDRDSTKFIGCAFAITLAMLLVAPILDYLQIATLSGAATASFGLVMMVCGLMLRYWASRTLGAYYTRTLLVKTDHHLVDSGPYRLVRNPGYLGNLLIFIGAGLAASNGLAVVVITVVLLAAYVYRIRVEESMLRSTFGDAYQTYMTRTWRLIPLVY